MNENLATDRRITQKNVIFCFVTRICYGIIMSSFEPSDGTFPLVFESGVINLDKDGVLHVHLTHSPDNPHPMLTHPDGEETTIPPKDSEVYLDGIEGETILLRCGIRETNTLPSGFVFHITGWRLLQLEMSGDLTVVMGEMHEIPGWFQNEKIHRFDGPEEGVRLYTGSQPLTTSNIQISNAVPTQGTVPMPEMLKRAKEGFNKKQHKKMNHTSNSGCGLLLFILGVALCFGATAIPLLT